MNKLLFHFILNLFFSYSLPAQVTVKNLKTENLTNPLGIDILQPAFSWQLSSPKRNVYQTAYEVRVSKNAEGLSKSKDLIWNSGVVKSDQSVHVIYAGSELQSGETYYWQVRVTDNGGKTSSWSEPAFFSMGLLKPQDLHARQAGWKAKWIEATGVVDSVNAPSILFRKAFTLSKPIKSAKAYITSRGMYEAYVNGKRVGDYYLTPGWTSYKNRLQYQTYDITSHVKNGQNAIGVTLGSGWYRTQLGWGKNQNFYGNELALLMQVEVVYEDGSKEIIISDETWKASDGPIRFSEIYAGEIYDANKEKEGGATASYSDQGWFGVQVKEHSKENLVATYNEPIKKHEVLKPVKVFKTPQGDQVIDFGQNLVGWVQMKVRGKTGDKVTITHAEVLDREGNFYTDNLRDAAQKTIYTLHGRGEEFFEPHFTFQGFRFIRVEGYPVELKPENFSAVALYSDMAPTGNFTCSNPLINKLQQNIQWGQKGNFLDVPTDCPQRDERLGWTGDAQVFARTAAFNMHVHNFFKKWLKDLAADQKDGSVPFVVPNILGNWGSDFPGGSAGWADAATIIPWIMYNAYGDKRILEEQYESMKAWVKFMESKSKNDLWNTGFHFGDWLFYRPNDDNDGRAAVTDKYLIAQCFYIHSTQLLLNTATLLNKSDDVKKYTDLLKRIRDAFMKEYVTNNGRLVSNTQTAYVLALHFDILPENMRAQAAERLVANIKDYNYHLTTGFLGTPYLCHVLTRFGYSDVAYTLLLQEKYPSWLYPVTMGATTIWERWDGQKPDGTFQTPGMNSFNHYAYGAIGDWMYRIITGIQEAKPGYKEIKIMPHIGGKLTHASAELQTYYGLIGSRWSIDNNKLQMNVEIPCNTTASVYIPAPSVESVKENGKSLSSLKDIKVRGMQEGYVVVETGSGKYNFTVDSIK